MSEITLHCLSRATTSLHEAAILFVNLIGCSDFHSMPIYIEGERVPQDYLCMSEMKWSALFPPHIVGSFWNYEVCIGSEITGAIVLNNYKKTISFSITLGELELKKRPPSASEAQFVLGLLKLIVVNTNCYLGSAMVEGFSTLPYFNPPNAPSLVRSSDWDAVPWPQWINYYSDQLVNRYGRDKLLSAPWTSVECSDGGFYLVVTEHKINYSNASDCKKLNDILHAIEYDQRFWEQAISKNVGTITYNLK